MRGRKILILIIIIVLAGVSILLMKKNIKTTTTSASSTPLVTNIATSTATPAPTSTPTQSVSQFAEPVQDYKARVTKKPFGIYVTPSNSPIQPERFTGYHTGSDAEYQDVTSDVPVYAIADCKIVLSETASGYGGVLMISFDLNGTTHTALYGHIRPSSLPKVGAQYSKGDQMGLLGTGYSTETDGERRHLHFAIRSDNSLSIKGYVQTQGELSGWIDPLTIL